MLDKHNPGGRMTVTLKSQGFQGVIIFKNKNLSLPKLCLLVKHIIIKALNMALKTDLRTFKLQSGYHLPQHLYHTRGQLLHRKHENLRTV